MSREFNNHIKILLVEDNRGDARIIHEMLVEQKKKKDQLFSYELTWVGSLKEASDILSEKNSDVVLLDLSLPDSKGLDTFYNISKISNDIPVIVMSGLDDEKTALSAVRNGAQDYLVKGTVNSSLLVRAIWYAIERKYLELERNKLIHDLEEALANVKTLSGLIPICANCKKIRDDEGYWN
ncbi:hypothetical protein DRQ07_04140, partial [candidate division KSB1 bacterium]